MTGLARSRTLVFTLLACAAAASRAGARTVAVEDAQATHRVTHAVEVLADPTRSLRLEDVVGVASLWGPPPALDLSPGRRVFWVRLRVQSRLLESAEFALIPDLWERVELYQPGPAGSWRVQRTGWGVPLAERPVWGARPVLHVSLAPGSTATLYLRFDTDQGQPTGPGGFGLTLVPWTRFLGDDSRHRYVQGAYAGFILAVVLYNLLLYFSVREHTYLLYVLYAGSFGLIWVTKSGLAFEVLWPAHPLWNVMSPFYIIAAAVFFGNRFVRAFLDTPRNAPRADRALDASSWAVGVALLLSLISPRFYAERMLAVVSVVTCVLFVSAGIAAMRRGSYAAPIYLVASGVLIVGTVAYALRFLGVLEESLLAIHGPQIGSAVEVVVLAFAVRTRIALLRRDKEVSQAQYRDRLESQVRERTADLDREKSALDAARREAEDANLRLQDANARLARISFIDDLTGISNRRHFDIVLDAEWRRCARAGQPLAVALIDVDHFKAYNDHYGHLAGDGCLQRVAGALAASRPRAGDFLARYGGEEFIVVLPGTDGAGAAVKAEVLRDAVQSLAIPHAPGASEPVVTISAGIGCGYPALGDTAATILAEADRALYAAKTRGRNQVVPAPGSLPTTPPVPQDQQKTRH